MRVLCITNLDLSNEQWPTDMPCLPAVGHRIASRTRHVDDFQLELEVTNITWEYDSLKSEWLPWIELHMTDWQRKLLPSDKYPNACQGSIIAFYEWYAPKVGRTVSAFI